MTFTERRREREIERAGDGREEKEERDKLWKEGANEKEKAEGRKSTTHDVRSFRCVGVCLPRHNTFGDCILLFQTN